MLKSKDNGLVLFVQPTNQEELNKNKEVFRFKKKIACPNCLKSDKITYKYGQIYYTKEEKELYVQCDNCSAKHFVNNIGVVMSITSEDTKINDKSVVLFETASYNDNYIKEFGREFANE